MRKLRGLIFALAVMIAGAGVFALAQDACCFDGDAGGYGFFSVYTDESGGEVFLTQAPPVPSRPRCAPCNGTGRMMCGSCGYRGWRVVNGERVTCVTCGGIGSRACRFCDGSGFRRQ